MIDRRLEKATLSRQIDIGSRNTKLGNNKLSMSFLAGIIGSGIVQNIMEAEDNKTTSLIKSGAFGIIAVESALSMIDIIRVGRSLNKISNLIMALQDEGINVKFGPLNEIFSYNISLEPANYLVNILELENAIIKEKISEDGISYQYIDCEDDEEKTINITDIVNENILTKRQKKRLYYK